MNWLAATMARVPTPARLSLVLLVAVNLALLVTARQSQDVFMPPSFDNNDSTDALPPIEDAYSNRLYNAAWGYLRSFHQTYHPNGRAIVPARIKKGTLLYHGRQGGPPPTGIDWFAFDAEHSHMFASRGGATVGTLWTFAATKDLKVLYFDGFSASKGDDGGLDVQDVLAGLELRVEGAAAAPPRPPATQAEGDDDEPRRRPGGGMGDGERAEKLCEWGKEFGIEGFVREEATFELMFCDTERNVRPVASTNISAPTEAFATDPLLTPLDAGSEPPPPPEGPGGPGGPGRGGPGRGGPGRGGPPGWGGPRTFMAAQSQWSFARAASWHHQIADSRVTLFPEYAVSLYDRKYTSLHKSIVEEPVRKQRLLSLSADDLAELKAELQRAITNWDANTSSGADWRSIIMAATDRYADRLAELRSHLDRFAATKNGNRTALADTIRTIGYGMAMPYLEAAATLNDTLSATEMESERRKEGFRRGAETCRLAFTGHMVVEELNEQEVRIKDSVEAVLGEICSFAMDLVSTSVVLSSVTKEHPELWRKQTARLMAWLNWPSWHRLPKLCDPDETPFVPMWPLGGGGPGRPGGPGGEPTQGEPVPSCATMAEFLR